MTRLLIALLISFVLTFVTTLTQEELLQLLEYVVDSSISYGQEEGYGENDQTNSPPIKDIVTKLGMGLNIVFWTVLIGWASIRFLIQFRNAILLIVILQILVLFMLDYFGIIDLKIHLDRIWEILQFLKSKIYNFGHINSLSFILGTWSGFGNNSKPKS